MIFYGRYRLSAGAFRPFITIDVLSADERWVKHSFLVDTGADITFLPHRSITLLGIDIEKITVKDDVGGVGGHGVPYFEYQTCLRLFCPTGIRVLEGKLNVFLDPHSTEIPLLGRDALDAFTCIFDRTKGQVLLLESPDSYNLQPWQKGSR